MTKDGRIKLRKGARQLAGIAPRSRDGGPASASGAFSSQCRTHFGRGGLSAREVGDLANSVDPTSRLARAKARSKVSKKASANSARSLTRTLQSSSSFTLHPCYYAEVPMWDKARVSSKSETLAFLPIHETLDALAGQRGTAEFTTFSEEQGEFQTALAQWAQRLTLTLSTCWAALSLWGTQRHR